MLLARADAPIAVAVATGILIAAIIAALVALRGVRRLTTPVESFLDGLRGFRDGDFTLRVAGDEAELAVVFNEAADALRARRSDSYQKELLLDMILQASPMAMLLTNAAGRVVFANAAARSLLREGPRVEGRRLDEVLPSVPEPVREAVQAGSESLFTVPGRDRDETFRFVRREFFLNTQRHTLLMFELLTPELRRQELAIWKRAIRTMNHELNNSISPLSSLLHSARVAANSPQHAHRVEEIYSAIEERLSHLRDFLAAYATFARMPAPRKTAVPWSAVIDDVRRLYPVEVEGDSGANGFFDRAQIEQLLINLVKNAHESGSPADEVRMSLRETAEGTMLRVVDRGCGLSPTAMRQALLPFYSTKPDGTGLGLALASEIVEAHGGRLSLQCREGGGTSVTVVLPSAGDSSEEISR